MAAVNAFFFSGRFSSMRRTFPEISVAMSLMVWFLSP